MSEQQKDNPHMAAVRWWQTRWFIISGYLVGLIGAILTVYAIWFPARPDLVIEILSDIPVVDVNNDSIAVDIYFNGQNISEIGQQLRSIDLRILNRGREAVREDDYAQALPLGLRFLNGQVAETPLLSSSSNEYLDQVVQIRTDSTGLLRFPKVVLEAGQWYSVRVLVLVDYSVEAVAVRMSGKIVNDDKFEVIEAQSQEPSRPSLFDYFIATLSALTVAFTIAVILTTGWIDRRRQRSREERLEKQLADDREQRRNDISELQETLASIYERNRFLQERIENATRKD
ncbi:MAG: hypothetical protein RhofKO_31510 [Rhodothermales bacterium]